MKVYIRLIRTKNISAKLIHIGMRLWSLLRGKKSIISYNHCEVGYEDMTSGAISKGISTRKWQDYVDSHKGKYFDYIEYEVDFTKNQWKKVKKYLDDVEGTPYEFENFWHHTLYIFTGRWRGSTMLKEIYCYEHGARVLNFKPEHNLDIYINPYEFQVYAEKNLKRNE